MKNLKNFMKAFSINIIIFSLINSSFIFEVNAQTKLENTETTGKEILNIANVAVATYGQFLGQKQQMIQQQIMAQRNQALMQSLSPSCRKPDGTACYTVAGKYFPECPIPASMSSMPQNVCSAASPDPAAISSMLTYESIAKGWINYFDQMQNEASNSSTPFGMKCLEDKRKALDSQLTEMQNNLTRLQDQLNKDKETFKANNKKLVDQMTTINDELVGAQGGSGKNNLNLKTKDFAKYFSQSCQSVIGDENIKNGASLGLLGIMQSLSTTNKKAADYNSNRALIESDLRRDIEKNTKLIADNGLADFMNKNPSETTKYGSVAVAIQKQKQEFDVAKNRIAAELKKIGYEIPPMDKNFSADFQDFLTGSTSYFRKQYINDCVTGADKSGTAISTEQILSSLQQRSTHSEGTARDKYKAALKTILDSDAFIEDKLTQIKALENTYKDISITYQNSNAQRVTTTPYDLYMKTLTACENRYKQDDTFSTSAQGVSQQKKVARGQALLRELQSLHDNYSSQLNSRVLEQAMNCNGESKKSGASCNGDSFDTANVNFCMSQAGQCANEIQGCYNEANNHVTTRKAKLEAMAKTFNNNAAALVARSNALYTAQKNAVMDMVKVVQARFPGTNFNIPQDMFITMPEMKKDAFGVDMVNDGNLSFMDELPKKLDLLKKVFKDQQVAVNKEIDDYIQKQSTAMSSQKERWQSLANECKNMIDTSSREIAKMNNENMKKQAEMDNKVKNFCRKYQALSSHPNGACESAKSLSTTLDEVSSRIVPSVSTNVGEFNNVCNSFGNEASSTSSSCKDTTEYNKMSKAQRDNCDAIAASETARLKEDTASASIPKKGKKNSVSLNSLCNKDGKPSSNSDFVEKVLGKLSKSDREKFSSSEDKAKLAKAISSGNFEEIDYNSVNDNDFLANISEMVSGAKGENGICEKLMAINSTKPAQADPAKVTAYNEAQAAADKFENDTANKDLKEMKADDLKAKLAKYKELSAKPESERGSDFKALEELNKKSEELTKLKTAAADAKKARDESSRAPASADDTKRKELDGYLADLGKAGIPAMKSVAQQKNEELSRIGEQIDTNTVCDAQAANTNVAKGLFSGSILPAGFDEKILGVSK